MATDYYGVLGISRDASKDEIKKAYKKLAKKYHPDVSKEKNAEQKFKEVNEAFSVLGDEKKRQQYDQFGTTDGQQGFGGFQGGFDAGDFSFQDIFDNFFGGGRRRRGGPQRGQDLQIEVSLTLEDVLKGTKKKVVVPRYDTCGTCKGLGAESESDIVTCEQCHGSGQVRKTARTPFGMFQQTATCSTCRGQGKEIKKPCAVCDGEGRLHKNDTISVDIPAGVMAGNQLRVAGKGNVGEQGGSAGDLFVYVHVEEHKIFKRDHDTIVCSVPLSFTEAALGAEIEVPTLDGTATLKIPAGTQTHTLFRMREKGLPTIRRSRRGDQLVRVLIEVPKRLSAEQKKILKEFERSLQKKSLKQKLFG